MGYSLHTIWTKMHFSKLEMKFVKLPFLVYEYKIISGGVRMVIYWSLNWYMYKFIHYFCGKRWSF